MNAVWLVAFGSLAALLLFLGGYTAWRGPKSDLLMAIGFAAPGLLIAIAVALDATGVIS